MEHAPGQIGRSAVRPRPWPPSPPTFPQVSRVLVPHRPDPLLTAAYPYAPRSAVRYRTRVARGDQHLSRSRSVRPSPPASLTSGSGPQFAVSRLEAGSVLLDVAVTSRSRRRRPGATGSAGRSCRRSGCSSGAFGRSGPRALAPQVVSVGSWRDGRANEWTCRPGGAACGPALGSQPVPGGAPRGCEMETRGAIGCLRSLPLIEQKPRSRC
jgi:hypothetical protein